MVNKGCRVGGGILSSKTIVNNEPAKSLNLDQMQKRPANRLGVVVQGFFDTQLEIQLRMAHLKLNVLYWFCWRQNTAALLKRINFD